jgi:hypothetical protein
MASHLRVYLRDVGPTDPGGWTVSAVIAALTGTSIEEHTARLKARGLSDKRCSGGRSSLRAIADSLHGRGRARMSPKAPHVASAQPTLTAVAAMGNYIEVEGCFQRLRVAGEVTCATLHTVPGFAGPCAGDETSGIVRALDAGVMRDLAEATTPAGWEVTVAAPQRDTQAAATRRMSNAAVRRAAAAKKAARAAAAQVADFERETWPQWDALADPVRARLAAYQPRFHPEEDWATVRPAALRLMSLAAPSDPERAATGLSNLIPYLVWRAKAHGATPAEPLTLEAVGDRDDIDTWLDALRAEGASDGTLATRRCEVRRAIDGLRPSSKPRKINYQPLQPPYAQVEMDRMRAIARLQPSDEQIVALSATIALCGGAGLASGEAGRVRPKDVTRLEFADGAWTWIIAVAGAYPRCVPVLLTYRDLLTEVMRRHALSRRDSVPFLRPRKKGTVSYAIAAADSADGQPVQILAPRLRNTWLVTQMQARVPLASLLRAAGLDSTRSLGDLLPYCPAPSDERITALLAQTERDGVSS